MNWVTIAIGVLALGYGIYSTCVRFTSPHKFAKLQAMKQTFGDTAGTIIHTVAYSVVPVVAGIIFIIHGSRGLSLF